MKRPRFLADENLDERLAVALERRVPGVDIRRTRASGLAGSPDAAVLEWAAREGRILVTRRVACILTPCTDSLPRGTPWRVEWPE